MGGEITYEHISAKKYTVKVTLYRDCNDCKFAGRGGGSSTNNCSDLTQVFLRTVTNTCGNKNIGSINLSKTGFENITEICDLNNSRCGTSPTVSYGIEAHYYTGIVDFANYQSYNGCGFQLFIHKSERSDDIVSISAEQQEIYTYAYINPWLENISSPAFEHNPKIVFQSNQATYASAHAISQNGDSLYYSWGIPETDYNTAVSYTSGYSASNWMTAYCANGTSNCPPNPLSNPPSGLYLNNATGDYTVTPTSNNEKTIRVVEVEQWRKNNGTFYLAGKIRREAMALVMSGSPNNPPIITPNQNYTLCVGQPFSATIAVADAPITTTVSDSVHLLFSHTISGLLAEEISTNSAPFVEAKIDFTPTSSQIGIHYISITATDNRCPVYASSKNTIRIEVVAKPVVSIAIDEKFCGTNEIQLSSNRNLTADLYTVNSANEISLFSDISWPYTHQELEEGKLTYNIIYTDELGCIDSISSQVTNLGNSLVRRAPLQGDISPCTEAFFTYHLGATDDPIENILWDYAGQTIQNDTLIAIIDSPKLRWNYTVTQESVECPIKDSVSLTVIQAPTILVDQPPVKCFSKVIDLNTINVSPQGGNWSYLDTEVNTLFDISDITINRDTTLSLAYSYEDINTGCSSSADISYKLKQSPEMTLRNQSICGTDNVYFLSNAIELPYAARDRDITWDVVDFPSALILTPRESLDVPSLGIGSYYVKGTNKLPNGCSTTDTAIVTVTDKLVITANDKREVCENNELIQLSDLLEISVEGGFWESNVLDLTNGITINTKKHCGPAEFKYVYDQNYCYAELAVDLDIVCKPDLSFSLPDSICADAIPITLKAQLQWTNSQNTSIGTLNPADFNLGKNSIQASMDVRTCTFDTTKFFEILSPITLTTNTLQTKLCEGDSLLFSIQKPNYSSVSIESCNQIYEGGTNNTYVPALCDLAAKKISLKATTKSNAHCPSHSANIDLPYHAKPSVILPENVSGCEPFVLKQAGLPPNINFTIFNRYATHSGTASELNQIALKEGKYNLSALKEDNNGCLNHIQLNDYIYINPKPYASFSMGNDDRLTLSTREISLYNYSSITSGSLNSNWYYNKLQYTTKFSSANNPTYNLPADTGVFQIMLVAESIKGCKDTSYQNVLVVPDIIAFIPSAFTPDNKGPKSNSVFRVTSDHAQEYSIDIFNKWGQKVYASKSIEEVWDGTYMGQFCQNGVYVYSIILINKAGTEYTYKGTVNLIR